MKVYLFSSDSSVGMGLASKIFNLSGTDVEVVQELGTALIHATRTLKAMAANKEISALHVFILEEKGTGELVEKRLRPLYGKDGLIPNIFIGKGKEMSPWDWLSSTLMGKKTEATITESKALRESTFIGPAFSFLPLGGHFNFTAINCPCDLFVRVSPNKYLKAITKGESFSGEIIAKYNSESKPLYVRRNDQSAYSITLANNAAETIQNNTVSMTQLESCLGAAFEVARAEAFNCGLHQNSVTLTQKVLTGMTKSIAADPELITSFKKDTLKQFVGRPSNFLTSMFALCGLLNMKSYREADVEKLALACLFRDIGLDQDYLSMFRYITPSALAVLSPEEVDYIRDHPERSVEIIKDNEIQVHGAEELILQHHESPRGDGFPGKMKPKSVHPLACLLIIAENLTLALKANPSVSVERLWKSFYRDHAVGNFKEPLDAMAKAFDLTGVVYTDGPGS